MLNFTHKPITPDKGAAKSIANSMRKRSRINKNKLDFLLSKTIGTKNIKLVQLKDVSDFPKFKSKELIRKLAFGTFQLRLCKSYMKDLINHGNPYIVSNDLINDLKDEMLKLEFEKSKTKIIAMEILPRHGRSEKKNDSANEETDDEEGKRPKRKKKQKTDSKKLTKKFSKVYKAFVQYEPNNNNINGIKGKHSCYFILL
jgi:hypothetical protein